MIKVNVSPNLWTKIDFITRNYNIEFGGYLVGEIRAKEIFLQDLLIPSQTVSGTHVDISHEAQLDLRKKYGDKVFKIIGHWHSHHSMGAFWSGTDLNNMSNIMTSKKLFVFIVTSTTGYKCRVSVREPIAYDLEDCELYIKSLTFDILRGQLEKIRSSGSFQRQEEPDLLNMDIDEEKKEDEEGDPEMVDFR